MGNTIRKKGDNPGGAIRKFRSRIARELFVTIINTVELKKMVGQRTT